ncbi:hypothetical protein IF1G_11275 [Cordyceps javanica]|uniref:Uncharacterized protein n=1 Tax=Cordyceps javanica TaxID=43265 RepID=A0A545UKT7_9HYPO|nr:hypothetical protein IF1G_11275 [Cordyceps javanica]
MRRIWYMNSHGWPHSDKKFQDIPTWSDAAMVRRLLLVERAWQRCTDKKGVGKKRDQENKIKGKENKERKREKRERKKVAFYLVSDQVSSICLPRDRTLPDSGCFDMPKNGFSTDMFFGTSTEPKGNSDISFFLDKPPNSRDWLGLQA